MQYGYTTAPHLSRVVITGPYNADRSRRHTQPSPCVHCKPASPADEGPAQSRSSQRCAPRVSTCAGRGRYRAAARLLSGRARQDRQLRGRHRDGAAPHPCRSGVHLPLRADTGRSGPGAPYRISDTELASRLSFFLWSSIPDEELLKLAIEGKLHQPAVLERQTRRMLADPKARALVTNFANQWLFLRELKNANPDVTIFPTSTTTCVRPSSARPSCCSRASCARIDPCSISSTRTTRS